MDMAVSHWLLASRAGGTTSGLAIPGMSATVPAGGRLAKVIINAAIGGVAAPSSGGPTVLGPAFHQQAITINSTEYPNRQIWYAYRLLRNTPAALFDSGTIPSGRVYTMWYGGADDELGVNQQVSFGGVGHGAITVQFTSLVSNLVAAQAAWSFLYDTVMRVLYYT